MGAFGGVPIWLVALLAAAAAPSLVRLFAASLERRVQRRTVDAIAQRDQSVGEVEETKEAEG
jgi:hypothetical protein